MNKEKAKFNGNVPAIYSSNPGDESDYHSCCWCDIWVGRQHRFCGGKFCLTYASEEEITLWKLEENGGNIPSIYSSNPGDESDYHLCDLCDIWVGRQHRFCGGKFCLTYASEEEITLWKIHNGCNTAGNSNVCKNLYDSGNGCYRCGECEQEIIRHRRWLLSVRKV